MFEIPQLLHGNIFENETANNEKKTFKIQHTNQEKRFAVWFHLVFLHVFH